MSYMNNVNAFSDGIQELSVYEILAVNGADRGDATAGGAVAGGIAGALAGAEAGASLGAWGGPAGFVAGLVGGAIVGGAIGYAAYTLGSAPTGSQTENGRNANTRPH